MHVPVKAKVPGRLKIHLVTDMEGVCGIGDFNEYCRRESLFRQSARRLLTAEANAAVDGFFAGGATEVEINDAHAGGGWIDPELMDPRATLQYGSKSCGWEHFYDDCDALAFVGQHAMAGTDYGHMAHTQTGECIDFRLNGISIGEFGQLALLAMSHAVPVIFAAGDEALAAEARALIPEIVAVGSKRGLGQANRDPCAKSGLTPMGSWHLSPVRARELIRAGAEQAARRYGTPGASYSGPDLAPPFVCAAEYRASSELVTRHFNRAIPAHDIRTGEHPTIGAALQEFYTIEWNA